MYLHIYIYMHIYLYYIYIHICLFIYISYTVIYIHMLIHIIYTKHVHTGRISASKLLVIISSHFIDLLKYICIFIYTYRHISI
jgi:hypothetical protein